ncbi:hypothetical protein MNBD_GAMMA25-871 [hydrothermal vent metagenome]|uniref:Uncharacterized protein n=1 Tax=hydrothermal vent metagenome TaxID=652676 RepID=A0A3B1BDZ3_9ZZZZ
MPKRKVTVMKSAALEKLVSGAMGDLESASNDGAQAIATCSNESKKMLAESKRISKKRALLTRRKKAASIKLKKAPAADTRKALRDVEKELTTVKRMADKLKPAKASLAEELKGLKEGQKRASAYLKVIVRADKILNKPKKKKRRRRVAKTV